MRGAAACPRASTSVKVPRGSRSSAISDNWIARSTICAARRRIYPRRPLRPWQQLTLLAISALLTAGLILLDGPGLFLWLQVLALPFFMIALVRLTAVWHALRRPLRRSKPISSDRRYRQSAADLFGAFAAVSRKPHRTGPHQAMARLDYPFDRFEILFITEADDHMTRRALLSAGLPPNMRIVTVPNGQPRTKPRALNLCAVGCARHARCGVRCGGHSRRRQLRRAANAFIEGGPRLACVQAQLAI